MLKYLSCICCSCERVAAQIQTLQFRKSRDEVKRYKFGGQGETLDLSVVFRKPSGDRCQIVFRVFLEVALIRVLVNVIPMATSRRQNC
jgi:hypothetical protein